MLKRMILWSLCIPVMAAAGPAMAGSLFIDAANGITWGDFTVQDVTANIEVEYFNPSIAGEWRFGSEDKFGVGLGWANSSNQFDGEWDGSENRHTEGEIDIERTTIDVYFRLLAGPHFNLRIGYRHFNYEFTDGELEKYQDGLRIETATDAWAEGALTKGIDLELNFSGGTDFQFRFGLGFSYFIDAEYDWEYIETDYNPYQGPRTNRGSATHDAMAVRLKPEFTFKLTDMLRLTLDYTLSASIWDGTTGEADIEDYPGVEIYSAFSVGIEFLMPLT